MISLIFRKDVAVETVANSIYPDGGGLAVDIACDRHDITVVSKGQSIELRIAVDISDGEINELISVIPAQHIQTKK